MQTKEFIRKARYNWVCEQCHQMIFAGTQYKDYEIHYVFGMDHSIRHKRICAVCAGLVKEPKIYRFKEPEPVMDLTDNMKYWLIGIGYKPGTKDLYLIARDWLDTKYHWKVCLWTNDGELLKTSNVRFVNA